MRDQPGPYASSPCMMHEFEEGDTGDAPRIFYLLIDEGPDGFGWEVRGHQLADPVDTSRRRFETEADAQDDGRRALDKVCAQFLRYDEAK